MRDHNYHTTYCANALRVLAADAVEKAASGHPGMPMGFADVMTVLAQNHLQFAPQDPKWALRDRLVLSAGHGSMLLYAFYYLAGYKDFDLNHIQSFRQLHSIAAGHPEYGFYPAIETTTGPLGQGLGNSVGMAIAQKKQQATNPAINYKVISICGDGCLMEGMGYEAMSLAGHLQLDNLIWLFDDNKITIDGSTSLTHSEDMLAKCQAMGWKTESVDGHNHQEIDAALSRAYKSDKPYFIACRTKIGFGAPTKETKESSHGAPLGADEIAGFKKSIDFEHSEFSIPQEALEQWRSFAERCTEKYNATKEIIFSANTQLPESMWQKLKAKVATQNEATRQSSGTVISAIMEETQDYIWGSADLSGSNNVKHSNSIAISNESWSGNFIHYGPREAVMGAIMNGITTQGFRSAGGTFLVFTDYMRPSMRLAAIMKLPVTYIMTHDSIGVGEDGPTHQPIEHLASFRAMPNMLVMRPCDYSETVECWQIATQREDGPSILALSRQKLPQLRAHTKENLSSKGAYILQDDGPEVNVVIFATGSEVSTAVEVKKILNNKKYKLRIISMPCAELYVAQEKSYRKELTQGAYITTSIEAASTYGWAQIIGNDGISFGIDRFGESAKAADLYEYFELTAEHIASKLEHKLKNI